MLDSAEILGLKAGEYVNEATKTPEELYALAGELQEAGKLDAEAVTAILARRNRLVGFLPQSIPHASPQA